MSNFLSKLSPVFRSFLGLPLIGQPDKQKITSFEGRIPVVRWGSVSSNNPVVFRQEPSLGPVQYKLRSIWGHMVANLPMEEFEKEGIHVLRVGGRLDATSAPLLERRLAPIIETPKIHLVMDLKNLSYLSSAGMRVMLAATKKLKAHQGQIVFSSAQGAVLEIIKMAGFENIFKFYPTELSALKAMKVSQKTSDPNLS
jgi:anti-anti-sigma factor